MSMKDDTDFEVYGFIKNKFIYNLRELFLCKFSDHCSG